MAPAARLHTERYTMSNKVKIDMPEPSEDGAQQECQRLCALFAIGLLGTRSVPTTLHRLSRGGPTGETRSVLTSLRALTLAVAP